MNRALSIVLVRLRISEVSQDTIAHVTGDVAFKSLDSGLACVLICAIHFAHVFGIKLLR